MPVTQREQNGGSSSTLVPNSDPGIIYSPGVCTSPDQVSCYGSWWDTYLGDGNVVKTSAGPTPLYNNTQNFLVYRFYGSSLDVYGLRDPSGSILSLQLDDGIQTVNTSTGTDGGIQTPALLSTFNQLNSSEEHTLTLTWSASDVSGGNASLNYAFFTHFMIQDFEATKTTESQTSVTSSSSASSSSQAPVNESKGVSIAAIVVSLLLFLSLVSAMLYYLYQSRFRQGPYPRRFEGVTVLTRGGGKGNEFDVSQDDVSSEPDASIYPLSLPPYPENEKAYDSARFSRDKKALGRYLTRSETETVSASDVAVASRLSVESIPSSPQISRRWSKEGLEFLSFDPAASSGTEKDKRLTYFSIRKVKLTKASWKSARLIRSDALGEVPRKPQPATVHVSKRYSRPLPSLPSLSSRLPLQEEFRINRRQGQLEYSDEKGAAIDSVPSEANTLAEPLGIPLSFDSRASFMARSSFRSVPPPYDWTLPFS